MVTSRWTALAATAGGLSVGAGLVHATAAGSHDGDLAALLALAAVVQVVLGLAVAVRPGRRTLGALGAVNLSLVAVWAASRSTGLPLVEGLAEPEAVGLQDITAVLMEAVAAGAAFVALGSRARARVGNFSPLWAIAIVPALLGMTAGHTHTPGHTPAGEEHHPVGVESVAPGLAGHPVFSGADTSRSSEAELSAAKDLIEQTRQAVSTEFPDEAALVEAGYRSIGDGFPITRFRHFVNASYLGDGRELDPARVESIVLDTSAGASQVVSAMYILELGKTMADAPQLGGELAAWHDHQNLCWDGSSTRLAGILVNGRCVPGGTLRATPPMLHVWLADHECGPFSGVDGHGSACGVHGAH